MSNEKSLILTNQICVEILQFKFSLTCKYTSNVIFIILSFNGEILSAIEQTNYQWLIIYPCLYFFAVWDAYKDAKNSKKPYSFLPFAFCAYSITVGLIYLKSIKFFGVLLGPVWLPMIFVIPGVLVGWLLQKLLSSTITFKN